MIPKLPIINITNKMVQKITLLNKTPDKIYQKKLLKINITNKMVHKIMLLNKTPDKMYQKKNFL